MTCTVDTDKDGFDRCATGDRLRKLLQERDMTQLQLSLDMDYNQVGISNIVNGRNDIMLSTAARISKALGVGLDEWVVLKE